MNELLTTFKLNFRVEGPLVEDDFHNFQALNLPEYHTKIWQILYNKDYTLLEHTSPVQIRTMLSQAPIRMMLQELFLEVLISYLNVSSN